jgi:murein L,D-transpeptidase YcbB/YkuD
MRASLFTTVALTLLGMVSTDNGSPLSSRLRAGHASIQSAAQATVAAVVERVLATTEHPSLRWSAIPDVVGVLKPLYESEPDRLVWFNGAAPVAVLESTLAAIAAVGDRGLHPADYDAAFLADQWKTIKAGTASEPDRAHFDLAVSVASARLIRAVHLGRVDPATMQWGYLIAAKRLDVAAAILEARQTKGLSAVLDALEPPVSHYGRAKRLLAAYKIAARTGEPPAVPDLPKGQTKIPPGAAWTGVPELAARLRVLGDLTAKPAELGSASVYGGALVEAVKRFQWRHGLDADGVLGVQTIRTLNVSLAHRIRQIELAMERKRWLPTLSDRPNVFVNVPLFRMWATDPLTGAEPLRMNVVVGQSLNRQTPIFVDQMEYVIFRPYWNPPYGITVKEIVPHVRRDPTYFDRENLEIVASGDDNAPGLAPTEENLAAVVAGKLQLRQKPGPKNSLGLAKFIFPNADNVYMHGTPAQQLFSRARRDFSHGCIRLEDPARFAEWVLRDYPEWTRARIDAAMQAARPTRVNLKQPITVVLFYDTVHVNSEAVAFFVDDIYGHDRALDVALQHGYPYPIKN